jgi:hypothetical protein
MDVTHIVCGTLIGQVPSLFIQGRYIKSVIYIVLKDSVIMVEERCERGVVAYFVVGSRACLGVLSGTTKCV